MKHFKTGQDYVVTTGRRIDTQRVRGYFCSLEYAEGCGERLRVGTEYTIWKRRNEGWFAYRTREAS